MANHSVTVLSRRSELFGLLEKACPAFQFQTGDGDARVAVIEEAIPTLEEGSLCRILLDVPAAENRRAGDFHLSRSEFLQNPEAFLLLAFDIAERERALSEARKENELLREVQTLSGLASSEMVSEHIARKVLAMLGLERATLRLHDPRVERYVTSFSSDSEQAESGEFLPGIAPTVLQRALSSGDSFAISASPGKRETPSEGQLVIPIQVGEDMIGVLAVPLPEAEKPSLEAIEAAAHYVRAVSPALGNIYQVTRSKDLAMRDDLTKAFNRRFFESYLDEEIERSRRYGSIFGVIFLDLDDLKLINNRYGHLTGSRMLQEVARRILGAVRTIDKVVRFGGDEFCIILPQTDQERSSAVAERVRKAIGESPFILDDKVSSSITASFGVACYPAHATTKEDLIHEADAAMYRVKSTTKNAIDIARASPVAAKRKTQ